MEKSKWLATESAPKNYPMEIVTGHLFYPDEGALYIPNKKRIHRGWGEMISTHIVGEDLKPLPDHLDITFYSYTEDQFYKGVFDLPYDNIIKLFNEGYYSPKVKRHVTYIKIMVGVAPGGTVSVWLLGIDKTTEVFNGQAEKVDVDWKRIIDHSTISRPQFIQMILNEHLSAEVKNSIEKNGIPLGLWQTYRRQYNWQPLFTGEQLPKLIKRINFYNGEEDYLYYPLDESNESVLRAIPKEMAFNWEWTKGTGRVFELRFDEEEIFDAFKQLDQQNQPIQMEMRMEKNDGKYSFSVRLRNEEEEIFLKRTDLKMYALN